MKVKRWRIEKRNINDLINHPKNPRKLSIDDERQLAKSIDKFGLIDLPVINHDNRVIGGHQRLRILQDMLVTTVDCWVPDGSELTDDEIDELNIRLNRNQGEWDWDILANEWEVNDLLDWGFSSEEIEGKEDKKKKNPQVIYEFSNPEDLKDFMRQVESLGNNNIEKTKIKL